MIEQVIIDDPTKTPVPWMKTVPFFEDPKTIPFAPGLNILWGPNGSGKSTLLKLLARVFHCEQGGIPKITSVSQGELRGKRGVKVVWDKAPCYYFSLDQAPGLIGGLAGFDPDFTTDGYQSIMVGRLSQGQQRNHYLNRILENAVKSVVDYDALKGMSPEQRAHFFSFFIRSEKTGGPTTLLLDEPERSADFLAEAKLWEVLALNRRFQLIVATHSPFAIDIPGANYIEFKPGYVQACRDALNTFRLAASREG